MNNTLRDTAIRLVAFLAAIGTLSLGGCTENLFDESVDPADMLVSTDDGKLRNAHLLDDAGKFLSRGKGGPHAQVQSVSLIFAVSDGVMEKQKVLERYRVLERYKVLERYEYNYSIDGFAIYVTDESGANEYDEFLQMLADDPEIAWFEPDFAVDSPTTLERSRTTSQEIPWSVAVIGGMESWTVSGDGSGSVPVDVYIVDSGVTHDDIDVVENIDFREGTSAPGDVDGHGTHIAGIAAAIDDTDGLVGVAPGARIHNLKVLDDDGTTDVSVVIAAVEYITQQKLASPSTPMVVNMSIGENIGTTAYTALDEAIEASSAAGVVYVAAAGNYAVDASIVTPAHAASAITVGSMDVDAMFSPYSNYGPTVDILAPGDRVVSFALSQNGTKIETMSGTSMAAAHVTGAAALILGANPSATPAQVKELLQANAKEYALGVPNGTTNKMVWVGEPAPSAEQTPEAPAVSSLDVRISASYDDAEEYASSGGMVMTSPDIDMMVHSGTQLHIGMRFAGLDIPQGATITNAYIQFEVDEIDTGATFLTFRAQDTANAPSFSSSSYNVSSRPTTDASANWEPAPWTEIGAAGADQRTPDLSAVVQAVVARPDWASGNAMVVFVDGTGRRTAKSYDGGASTAPLLHVEWTN